MTPHVEWLAKHWDRPISVVPNAGLPILVDGRTEYPLQAEPMAPRMSGFVGDLGVSMIGGCCGTTTKHIGALRGMLEHSAPASRSQVSFAPSTSSVFGAVEHRQQNSVQIVGERTNASGSRAFKRLLEAEDWDAIVELASEQASDGSQLRVLCGHAGGCTFAHECRTLVGPLGVVVRDLTDRLELRLDEWISRQPSSPSTVAHGAAHSPGSGAHRPAMARCSMLATLGLSSALLLRDYARLPSASQMKKWAGSGGAWCYTILRCGAA